MFSYILKLSPLHNSINLPEKDGIEIKSHSVHIIQIRSGGGGGGDTLDSNQEF